MISRTVLIDCALAVALAMTLLAFTGLGVVAVVVGCVALLSAVSWLVEAILGKRRKSIRRARP